MKSTVNAQLQTPATSAQESDTSTGGSYRMVDGKRVLQQRTEYARVSRKAPLTDAQGNPVPVADINAAGITGTD